jgi:hypothetical protein
MICVKVKFDYGIENTLTAFVIRMGYIGNCLWANEYE